MSCPCKLLPLSLSSFTAAEYGNMHALMASTTKRRENSTAWTDSSSQQQQQSPDYDATKSLTPLHLAAQHGQVAATAFLLSQERQQKHYTSISEMGATPLHRASFSGAVHTMRLLLESMEDDSNSQNTTAAAAKKKYLLARDGSFGDGMTALHKAAAGGRFLAVQLLLDALYDGQCLEEGLLLIKDSCNRTPRDVAVEKRRNADEERQAVARWNTVAGGPPDWDKCVQLLRSAEFRLGKNEPKNSDNGSSSLLSSKHNFPVSLHKASMMQSCVDCTQDGRCWTLAWQESFSSALLEKVQSNVGQEKVFANFGSVAQLRLDDIRSMPVDANLPKTMNEPAASKESRDSAVSTRVDSPPNTMIGDECNSCHKRSIVLYQRDKVLVCKQCRRIC